MKAFLRPQFQLFSCSISLSVKWSLDDAFEISSSILLETLKRRYYLIMYYVVLPSPLIFQFPYFKADINSQKNSVTILFSIVSFNVTWV